MELIKILVVGAGFSGAVVAEQIASVLNKKVLVIDKRNHIAGNAFDCKASNGVLYHKYGPHYFRTNSEEVIKYLSKFTKWIENVNYTIKSSIDGKYYSFPINLNTFCQIKRKKYTEKQFIKYLDKVKIKIEKPINSEEIIISQVGEELYNLFFKNYTIKQWKKHPKDLDSSVCGRIPIRTNSDERYFNDKYQYLPLNGYSYLIENLLDHKNIKVKLNTSMQDIDVQQFETIFYTGPIDEYFKYCYGELPYRSLKFKNKCFDDIGINKFFQPAVQINYPNEHEYTRSVEIKHISQQKTKNTLVTYEYPDDWKLGKEAYYPIPCKESHELYLKYKNLADLCYPRVIFLGRLAKYKYYNIDQVVAMALHEFNKLYET